jgi:hypothetical protein
LSADGTSVVKASTLSFDKAPTQPISSSGPTDSNNFISSSPTTSQ